jgi:Tol biopolymer transport system component/DNA-binding SARP family transcriptional activator
MIKLRMLGEIQLRAIPADGVEVDALLRQSKRLALLAYLASPAPGTWHRRDVLLALFWPELDTGHARTSLRNALHVLRRTLGDAVLRTRGDEEVSIDPALVQSDLAEVWAALRDDRAEAALAHYGGELLVGLFPPDSDGFMRWLETERARLRVALSSAATARVNELERDGNVERALAVARRIVEINRDDETLVRRLMSLHEMSGDRAGALHAFESYRARLASDFDAEPAPETVAIATRLRSTAPLAFAPPAKRASLTPAPAPLAGSVSPARKRTMFTVSTVAVAALATGAAFLWSALRPVRLTSIGKSAPLTADEGLHVGAAISSNGRLVAYAQGNPRLLQIYVGRIGGGPAWRLTRDSGATELMPRWAPDNDQVLFLSRNNAYVVPSTGGEPRMIARGTPGRDPGGRDQIDGQVRSASWSPKGDSIAIVRNDSLIARPVTGAGSRTIGVARGRQLHSCVWSPASTWIACVAGNPVALQPGPLFGNEAPSAIVLFPSVGGNLVELTGNEFQHKSPAWSPDGKSLWLVSNREGEKGQVYAVAIGRDGRRSGPFARVGLTAESIDLSAKRIAYSVPVRRSNIWAVPVPRDTAVLAFSAVGTPITSGTELIELLNVTPDGRWLVYDSDVHGNPDIFRLSINADIFHTPVNGGSGERLTDDPRDEYGGVLSPDGRELVWHRYVKGKRRLFSRHLDSDSAHEISFGGGDQGVPHWSPDGRSLVAWSHDTEEGAVFVMRRAARGMWQPPAWKFQGGRLPGWSPDGHAIAFIAPHGGIATIPADSGAVRVVYRPRPDSDDPTANRLIWKDRSTIWFIGSDWRGRSGIWSVPARGGDPRLRVDFDDPSGRANGPGFATDGKRFYIALDERFSNVRWAELVR